MNWELACDFGLKVLAAVLAGAAVFVGIDKATHRGKSIEKNKTGNVEQSKIFGNDNPMTHQPPTEVCGNGNGNNGNIERSKSEKFLDGLKGATGTCSKLLAFVQSLTSVAENFSRIFRDGGEYYNYNYGGYGYGYYGYPPPYQMGGQTWQRINPLIVEAAPSGNYSRNLQYPI